MFIAEQKRKMIRVLKMSSLAFLFFYFTFHVVSGDKGLLTMMQLSQQVDKVQAEKQQVAAKRSELEDKVERLYTTSLDKDLLDERARKLLGMARENEIVVFAEN